MKRSLLLLILAFLLCGPGAFANKSRARDLFKKGMAEYVLERWDQSIHYFEAGFREEPLPEFLFNIAQAHRKAGRHAEAIRYFKKYLELAPDDAPDRASVETSITEEQRALDGSTAVAAAERPGQRSSGEKPTTSVTQPAPSGQASGSKEGPVTSDRSASPGATTTSSPPAEATTPPSETKPAEAKRRWPLWVGIGAGAAVLVGTGLGVGLALGLPNNAPIPSSSAGNANVMFP